MGQDGEDGQGRDRLTTWDFEVERRRDRRFERRLLVKELVILLAIAALVAARLLLAR